MAPPSIRRPPIACTSCRSSAPSVPGADYTRFAMPSGTGYEWNYAGRTSTRYGYRKEHTHRDNVDTPSSASHAAIR